MSQEKGLGILLVVRHYNDIEVLYRLLRCRLIISAKSPISASRVLPMWLDISEPHTIYQTYEYETYLERISLQRADRS